MFKTTLDERNVDAYLVSCSVFGPQIGEVVVSRCVKRQPRS